MHREGKYYLYYCLATSKDTEGVAVSDSPAGPFRDGRVMDVGGVNQIDPAVFVDDDGQAYYLWGQGTVKMAKLKPNMTENERLARIHRGDAAAYKYLRFDGDERTLTLRVAPGPASTRIQVRAGSLFGWGEPLLAEIDVPGGGDGETWTTLTAKVQAPEAGVHAVWLRFWSEAPEGLAEVDWFEFE